MNERVREYLRLYPEPEYGWSEGADAAQNTEAAKLFKSLTDEEQRCVLRVQGVNEETLALVFD